MRAIAVAALASAALAPLAGCGKSLRPIGGEGTIAALGASGASGLVTKNTARLGGTSPEVDAAAIARAAYPSLSPATRPAAVVLVDEHDWPAALAASVLAGAPLKAPLLYTNGIVLGAVTASTLTRLAPGGAGALGGAQAVRVGSAAAPPELRLKAMTASEPAELAVEVERLASQLDGRRPRQLIVTAAEAPAAMTAPAAGLAAQSGSPILYVSHEAIPQATRAELRRLGRPSVFVVGPISVVSSRVVSELRGLASSVTRIAGRTAVTNAIAVARFTDGAFGWGVEEPGHGLVFANLTRPLDGPAAAALSASGDYGPLLLLDGGGHVPPALARYVSDLQPGAPPTGPVRGVYNHGWLIGDEHAIPPTTQAQLDGMLEISLRVGGAEPTLSTTGSEP